MYQKNATATTAPKRFNFRAPQEQAAVDSLTPLYADLSLDEYICGDWKTKEFPNIDHLRNAGLDHALDVDLMSDETDCDGKEKEEHEGALSPFSPPPLLSRNNDDNHVDTVMEFDMNSSSNMNSNHDKSGSYQYVCRPWYIHELLSSLCAQKTD